MGQRPRSSRIRWGRLIVVPVFLSAACALVADLGDRTLATDAGPDGSSSSSGDATNDRDTASNIDGGDLDANQPPPSYCDGITLYVSYDKKLEGDRGGGQIQSIGSGVTHAPTQGKFGGAASLLRSPQDEAGVGASLYYVGSGATGPFPEATGSLAVWYRKLAIAPNPVLYRPVGSLPPASLKTAGVFIFLAQGNESGLFSQDVANGAVPLLTFTTAEVNRFLRSNEYNHYFTAWRKPGGGAGPGPTGYIALNGGLGVVFNDAGNAVTYPNVPDDAGELRNPFRGFTSKQWVVDGPPVGLRLGGPGGNSPDGVFDDLVIWDRVISFEELSALYSANKPVGDVCKIQ